MPISAVRSYSLRHVQQLAQRRSARRKRCRAGSVYIEAITAVTMICLLFAGIVFFFGMYHSKVVTLRQARQQAFRATLGDSDCDGQIVGISQLQARSTETATRIATGGQLSSMALSSATTMGCNEVPTENQAEDKGAIDFLVDRALLSAGDFLDSASDLLVTSLPATD